MESGKKLPEIKATDSEEKKSDAASTKAKTKSTTSKAMRLIGAYKSVAPIPVKSKEPNYIAVYCYKGNSKRLWIGHTALFDGNRFYNYGSGDAEIDPVTKAKLEKTTWIDATDEKTCDTFWASKEAQYNRYGPYWKVLIPIDREFIQNRTRIQNTIDENWKPSDYSIRKHTDCTHMVMDYLKEAKLIPEQKEEIVLPSTVDKLARALGLDRFKKFILNDQKKINELLKEKPKMTPKEEIKEDKVKDKELVKKLQNEEEQKRELIEIRRNFLLALENEINVQAKAEKRKIPKGMRKLKLNNTEIMQMTPQQVMAKYYELVQVLAEKYYTYKPTRSIGSDRWYMEMVRFALNPGINEIKILQENLSKIKKEIIYSVGKETPSSSQTWAGKFAQKFKDKFGKSKTLPPPKKERPPR